jgi:hypothetical protein
VAPGNGRVDLSIGGDPSPPADEIRCMRHLLTLLSLTASVALFAQPTNQGPDAPLVTVTYSAGTGFTFNLTNPITSTNYMEAYQEVILPAETSPDPVWRFQGYVIMQFASEADMDDSVGLVVLDPDRARPAMLVDLNDAVTQVTYNTINGSDSCTAMTWFLTNAGTSPAISVAIDPFTLAPYEEDSTYCFMVQAFATNPYHLHPTCGTPEQMIVGWSSPVGSLWRECISPATVGIAEIAPLEMTLSPTMASDQLNISIPQAGECLLRCVDARGALVHEQRFRNSAMVDVQQWPGGCYHAVVLAADGRSATRTFVVGH